MLLTLKMESERWTVSYGMGADSRSIGKWKVARSTGGAAKDLAQQELPTPGDWLLQKNGHNHPVNPIELRVEQIKSNLRKGEQERRWHQFLPSTGKPLLSLALN